MASSLRTFNINSRLSSGGQLKFALTRLYCRQSTTNRVSEQRYQTHVEDLFRSVLESVVTVESTFSGPGHRYSPRRFRRGGGVFIDPTLILTSAHAIGRISTSYEPKTPPKPDQFEQGCVVHTSELATTVAVTRAHGILETKPLAVNFGQDVAVLKVVAPPDQAAAETSFPQHCSMAKSPPRKGDIFTILYRMDLIFTGDKGRWMTIAGNVRAKIGEKTFRAKAPWPIDNDSPWMEYDCYYGDKLEGYPTQWISGFSFNSKEEYNGSVADYNGSPLFNIDGELVGIGSWFLGGEGMSPPFTVGFAAPLSQIRAAVDYAKKKKSEDPIVMDKWITL